jgi:N-acetylgalactosamine-6-sulfatase
LTPLSAKSEVSLPRLNNERSNYDKRCRGVLYPTAVDLLCTFAEVAGAKLPDDYQSDGESIVAAIKGAKFQRTKPIFWEWRGKHSPLELWPHQGVRDGKWKLLINRDMEKVELYDIEKDWAEQENLAPTFPDVVEKLERQILEWKNSLSLKPAENCLSVNRQKKS